MCDCTVHSTSQWRRGRPIACYLTVKEAKSRCRHSTLGSAIGTTATELVSYGLGPTEGAWAARPTSAERSLTLPILARPRLRAAGVAALWIMGSLKAYEAVNAHALRCKKG